MAGRVACIDPEAGGAGLVDDDQRGAVGAQFGRQALEGVEVGADRAVRADFAVAAGFGHGDDGGILVDIEPRVLNVRFHVLVLRSWWFGERLHHAAPVAFRD